MRPVPDLEPILNTWPKKKYDLEHTNPSLINSENILSIHHPYIQLTFIAMFKIMKERLPTSLYELFIFSPKVPFFLRCPPEFNSEISRQNFICNGSLIPVAKSSETARNLGHQ